MKYIKIIYDVKTNEANRIEYPRLIDNRVVSRREAYQNISSFIKELRNCVYPSMAHKDGECWFVTLHKYKRIGVDNND